MKKNIFTKTLGVVTTAIAVGSVFFAIGAKAEEFYVNKFTCNNIDGATLVVFHDMQNESSKKAMVHLQSNAVSGMKVYTATYEPAKVGFQVVEGYDYKIYDGETEVGTAKIKTQKKVGRGGGFCGRAGCDFPPSKVIPVFTTYAAIQVGEYEDSFDCN